MKIYVFGNPLVKNDSIPLMMIPELEKSFPDIQFIITDPNENFPPENEKDLIILDTVKGITEARLFDLSDLKEISQSPISPHDYDLLFHLLLLKKRKIIDRVKIIGVPLLYDRTKVVQVKKLIRKLISQLLPGYP